MVVTKAGISITALVTVAETTFAGSPQTVISLLDGLFVTKPAPFNVSCLLPANELVTEAVTLGSDEKPTVTVAGVTTA